MHIINKDCLKSNFIVFIFSTTADPHHWYIPSGLQSVDFFSLFRQGLRIAPPEAPVTGYMFGKGVYFADMVSKESGN